MRFDLDQLEKPIAYKLLAATVMPRPIAWITTLDTQGRVNAAPYSFFNAMGAAPPTVAVGMLSKPDKGLKDTPGNILATGEFVVNLVSYDVVEQMNITALDAPFGVDELKLAGLTTTPSEHISPPCIVESPVSFECVNLSTVVTGPNQTIVIGRVLAIHVDDHYIQDADQGYIDTPSLDLVGRSFGSEYVRTTDRFDLQRPTWQDWIKTHPDDDNNS